MRAKLTRPVRVRVRVRMRARAHFAWLQEEEEEEGEEKQKVLKVGAACVVGCVLLCGCECAGFENRQAVKNRRRLVHST